MFNDNDNDNDNDNGAGMHVHQSLWKGGQPLFFGEGTYANMSQTARWYIGVSVRLSKDLSDDLVRSEPMVIGIGASQHLLGSRQQTSDL